MAENIHAQSRLLRLGRVVSRMPRVLQHSLLVFLAAVLFAFSFPNVILVWGFFPLAFIALFPIAIVIHRARTCSLIFYAGLFVVIAYTIFNYWLLVFNPIALFVVIFFRMFGFILLFLTLKLVDKLFPVRGYLLQASVWVVFEFIGTQGFLGYSFGILGYSQYLFSPLLQLASVTAVWGISLILAVPGFFIGTMIKKGITLFSVSFRKNLIDVIVYGVIFVCVTVFGLVSRVDAASLPQFSVSCVQPNSDPWKGGNAAYEKNLATLMRLSREAETSSEKPQLVVWPETAIVPSIRLHSQMRYDQERYNRIVKPFLQFMDTREIPYLTGNNDRELAGKDAAGNYIVRDYNSAVLFDHASIVGVYRKTHLVPFTESFPYKDIFPGIHEWLQKQDTHFYDAGDQADADFLFVWQDVRFATPICFEDTFADPARSAVNNGANLIINLTNDAWSHSLVAQMQHFSISVFRAVENRRSLVRSTASGMTGMVDPNGHILALAPAFEERFITASVPINAADPPLATLWGDWFGIGLVIVSGAALLFGLIRHLLKKKRRDGELTKIA